MFFQHDLDGLKTLDDPLRFRITGPELMQPGRQRPAELADACCEGLVVDGERDVDKLCDKVGPQGESLIVQILAELGKLEVH